MDNSIYIDRQKKLRERLAYHNADAYIILTDDFHASEYVCDYFKCREYMSGFTGSAGIMVITADEAALWTDGRYFIQANEQLEGKSIKLMRMGMEGVPTVLDYLADKLADGAVVAYDGRTISAAYAEELKKHLEHKNITYIEECDLVGEIWQERPPLPAGRIWKLADEYSGEAAADKLKRVRVDMAEISADYHVVSSLDEIAWLYNFRGSDIKYTPVALAYTLIGHDTASLYVAASSVDEELSKELSELGVSIKPYFNIYEDVKKLSVASSILLDAANTNVTIYNSIPKSVKIIDDISPIERYKAKKNPVEMENIRKAHVADAVALTRLIYSLKKLDKEKCLTNGDVTELDVSKRLYELRKQGEGFIEESFAAIIATGEHGAIVHYEPDENSDMPIADNTFLLMDTGGHYLNGTTDVTRTISVGDVSEQQRFHYTMVLKGNLRLGAAVFKKGAKGSTLDILARQPLAEHGLDYRHGTGHGVGYLMNVHEGPQCITPVDRNKYCGFEEGMLTSDEPGIYIEGEYGIRLENLMLCVEKCKTEYGDYLCFETVTLVPFDRAAINVSLLNSEEKEILNKYHKRVYDTISPYLDEAEAAWLYEETRLL